jgi:hypothetical protein
MKQIAYSLRFFFLILAVAVTTVGLLPSDAQALKSCEYYCGPAGPDSCYVTSTFICPSYAP